MELVSGAATEGAITPASQGRSVQVVRREDGTTVMEQDRMLPDVFQLLSGDWETLSEAAVAERWLSRLGRIPPRLGWDSLRLVEDEVLPRLDRR